MNHKKITVAGIMVAMLFSFTILKPMGKELNQAQGDQDQENLDQENLDSMTVENKEPKPLKNSDRQAKKKKKRKEKAVNFTNIKNFTPFKSFKNLKTICIAYKNVDDFPGLSTSQNARKYAKLVVDSTISPLVFGTLGWLMRDITKEGVNLKKLILPTIATTISAAHWFTKDYLGKPIKEWDKTAAANLHKKQTALYTELAKIDNRTAFDENISSGSHKDAFKSITCLIALFEKATSNKNFGFLKETYEQKLQPLQKWLKQTSETDKKDYLGLYMPGAQNYVEQLMITPPPPPKKTKAKTE